VAETTFRLRDDALEWREVEEQIVALDLKTSRYLALNRSGRVLWERLAGGATMDELIDALVEAYELDRERAGADVEALLAQLEDEDLILREEPD
jgi:Coenzyme PQQ synthesis protein D (PqqD)